MSLLLSNVQKGEKKNRGSLWGVNRRTRENVVVSLRWYKGEGGR